MGDGLDAFAISPGLVLTDPWRDLLQDPLPSHLPEPEAELATEGEAAPVPEPRTCDPHEFAALYMRHRWSFVRLAGRYLKDARDADEVVQEAFLRLFLALPELDNEIVVLSYCRRTITNLCIDRLRSDQRRPRLVNLSAEVVEELSADQEPDPVEVAEDAAVVREALSLLSPLHREALIKREIEEKPLPQIAEELDIPVDSVKHVLHRARRALRRLLVGTTVEPGVDLSVGVVLAANRERAAQAATSAMGLALILVMSALALLGFVRQQGGDGPADEVLGDIAISAPDRPAIAPQGRIPGPPVLPEDSTTGNAQSVPNAPTVPGPDEPGSAGDQQVQPPGQGDSTDELVVPQTQPSPAVKDGPTGIIDDDATPPPSGEPGRAEPSIALAGVPGASTATLRQSPSTVRLSGERESSSEVVAESRQGRYSLTQYFLFDDDGDFVEVGLAELVPTDKGPVRTVVPTAQVRVRELADGVLRVQVTGSSTPPADEGSVVPPRTVLVDVLFSADRREILGQRLSVSSPTVVTPVPTPVVSGTPRPTPSTPSASPSPAATTGSSIRRSEDPTTAGAAPEVTPTPTP